MAKSATKLSGLPDVNLRAAAIVQGEKVISMTSIGFNAYMPVGCRVPVSGRPEISPLCWSI